MVVKYLLSLLTIFPYILVVGCSIIPPLRPIHSMPTPQSIYGKNQVSVSYYPLPVINFFMVSPDINAINTGLNLQISDILVSFLGTKQTQQVNYSSLYSYSFGVFLGYNFWLKSSDCEYPWGNLYVGINPSFISYNEEYYLNIDGMSLTKYNEYKYLPIDLYFGFKTGIYRENYNLNLALRGGVGLTIPLSGNYFSGGIGIQGNLFIGSVGLGLNLEYIPAIRRILLIREYGDAIEEYEAILFGFAPLINLYLIAKF